MRHRQRTTRTKGASPSYLKTSAGAAQKKAQLPLTIGGGSNIKGFGMNQIINMIIRVIMRRAINTGINAGIGAASGLVQRRKRKNPDGPAQVSQADQPREANLQDSAGQAKKMLRMGRRFTRF